MLKLFAIIFFFYSFTGFCNEEATSEENLNWLAFGDLRGEIEPCGCDPKTNYGGVKRIATIVTREKSAYKNIVLINLGNNFSLENPSSLKNFFIGKAIEDIQPTITLLNEAEFKNKSYVNSNLTYVISHAPKDSFVKESSSIKNFYTTGQNIFFGFVEIKEFADWSSTLEKSWRDIAKRYPGHKKFLLYSGSQETLKKIALTLFFDEIISSNIKKNTEESGLERDHPESLLRLSDPSIYMVPLFGSGVLRGGSLRVSHTKSILELMNDVNKHETLKVNTNKTLFQVQDSNEYYTWLNSDYELGSPLSSLLEQYNKQIKEHFLHGLEEKRAWQKNSPFVGAKACQECHPQAFSIWEKTKHAKAYETLAAKNKNFDGACLTCHVVGLNSKAGGFISKEETPHLLGVQCENCHNPRKEHVQNPIVKLGTKENVCQSCHQGTHSPDFERGQYWNQIKHGF